MNEKYKESLVFGSQNGKGKISLLIDVRCFINSLRDNLNIARCSGMSERKNIDWIN